MTVERHCERRGRRFDQAVDLLGRERHNPDEWVWNNVKAAKVGRAGITSAEDLSRKATAALDRLVEMSEIIRNFFCDPDLGYISTGESTDLRSA